MGPGVAEAFDKDVAADLDILQQLLVVREGAARLAVDFREPHLFQQLCGIQDVLEASKCVVEVAHLRPDKREGLVIEKMMSYLLSTSSHSPATDLMYSYSSTIEMSLGRSPMKTV